MKLNPLLVATAIVYASAGIALTFAPAESLVALGEPASAVSAWVAQLLGAALLGLAVLNYVQRYSVVGGILGRPVLLSNLVFLSVSFFASLNSWRHGGGRLYLVACVVLGALFVAFGARLVTRIAAPGASTDRTASTR